MKPHELSLPELIANAHVLADTLRYDKRPGAAKLVLELIARVVPVRVVPTRGKPIEAQPVKLAQPKAEPLGMVWCDQCEHRVAKGCTSQFCKVVA